MDIAFIADARLPQLSWLCRIPTGSQTATVIHGSGVATGTDFFFEGAWAGPYADRDFLDKAAFGTGARLVDDTLVFSLPDHLLDAVFVHKGANGVTVSNTLAFLLSDLDLSLDTNDLNCMGAITEVVNGISDYRHEICTAQGNIVDVRFWHNFSVNPAGQITFVEKVRPADFTDFASYKAFLLEVMQAVFDNANDPARPQTFAPLATLSSGYDSTMIAALAADLGCKDALCFPEGRQKTDNPDFTGAEIGEHLGYDVIRAERLGYLSATDFPETETYGVGSELSSARDIIANTLLLTGYMGDTMWDRITPGTTTELRWSLPAGQNYCEMRLAAGFTQIPVPFIGAMEHPKINAISHHEEMAPWTLYSTYDRPICRRIAEEAGVPRDLFGQAKKVTGVFFFIEGLRETMTPQSYADYMQFRNQHWSLGRKVHAAWQNTRWWLWRANVGLNKWVFKRSSGRIKLPKLFPSLPYISDGALLIHWATNVRQKAYKAVLNDL